ncbi:MAG: cation diffusion facilitator family transporter [Proteobacteria bacterium]|nr:cation diffusion facilitator family transporter [Pseudomonadota bacterium]
MKQEIRDARLRAGWISLAAGVLIFGGKLSAYWLTDSTAVFSDAMESIINIVAGALLVFSLAVAARPADRDHPYGHGKVEFFTAGIEGSFILLAALLIVVQAVRELVAGPELRNLDLGVGLLALFGAGNAVLGVYLVRTGRRTHSIALVADGKHVLTDVWTSAGVFVGLLAVWLTGWMILDPLVAIAAAANILRQGWNLTRDAVRGLMDEADEVILAGIVSALQENRKDEWIDIHSLRAWRSGAMVHTDFHMTVPRYLDVQQIHGIHEAVESTLRASTEQPGDVVVHFDPCTPRDCTGCTMRDCPVRESACRNRPPLTLTSATRGDEVHAEG